ncbi:MAG: acyltransferase [Planctomycetes bacterium]|nr:acyltransferase [Planctomycetota bacterium]
MDTKLPPEDSRRLATLRFPLIVAVVFIHANNHRIGMADPSGGPALWVHWFRRMLSEGLAAVAVPLFFLVSGYLFFAGWRFSRQGFGAKLRSRTRTIGIPYLIWNVALALALALAHALPATRGLLSGKQGAFLDGGPWEWLKAIGGLDGPPVVYQFWFLRDLMVAILLVPLWSLAHRFQPALWAAILGGLWFSHSWPLAYPSIVALLFFYLGSWVAARGRSLFFWDGAWPWLALAYVVLLGLEIVGGHAELHLFGILLGIAVALAATQFLRAPSAWGDRLQRWAAYSFMVFALHEPLLTVIQRLTAKVIQGTSPWLDLILYLAIPTVVVIGSCWVHAILSRIAPRFAAWITGGRA